MKNHRKYNLLLLLLFISAMMISIVHAWRPWGKPDTPSLPPPPKQVVKPLPKPELPKPIIIPGPHIAKWENLNEGFVIPPGKTSVVFPLDRDCVVDEIKVHWTDFGKNAQGFLLFDKEKISQYPPMNVGINAIKNWFPSRKAKSFRIQARNSPIRLFFVYVTYKTQPEFIPPKEGKPTPTPRKVQVYDDVKYPLKVMPSTYSPYFSIDKPSQIEKIEVHWQSLVKAKGCLLYDNQIPTPDKFRIVIKNKVDTWVPEQRVKRIRIYAKGAPILINQVIIYYK